MFDCAGQDFYLAVSDPPGPLPAGTLVANLQNPGYNLRGLSKHALGCLIRLPGWKKRPPSIEKPTGKGGGFRPTPFPEGFSVGGGCFPKSTTSGPGGTIKQPKVEPPSPPYTSSRRLSGSLRARSPDLVLPQLVAKGRGSRPTAPNFTSNDTNCNFTVLPFSAVSSPGTRGSGSTNGV